MTSVDDIWPRIRDGLQEACEATGGDIDAEYLWSECRSGSAYLLVILIPDEVVGAIVCRFENWISGKKLRSIATWAKKNTMKDWWPLHVETLKDMMKQGGATSVVGQGRPFGKLKGEFSEVRELSRLYEWIP